MKETIYTIPIMDAFQSDYDCPFCYLKDKLEDDGIEYFLGGSLMTSEGRDITNEHGFCREHWEKLFVSKKNPLGLGLIMDTYLQNINHMYFKSAKPALDELSAKSKSNVVENVVGTAAKKLGKNKVGPKTKEFINFLSGKNQDCSLCARIEENMNRYVENFFYMWQSNAEFKELFNNCEGFCMDHFLMLLDGAGKYLSIKNEGIFAKQLISKEYECLKTLQKDVNWFTKKFDYQNSDKPWENSKDAVQRSIRRVHSSRLDRKEMSND